MDNKKPGIKREEFWYDSRDGVTKIHAVRWVPENGEIRAILQISHGMTEHVLRYEEFAQWMAGQGILVVGNDHLGHGLSRREDVPFGYFCKRDAATVVVRDIHRLKKLTQENNPGVPYFILGHSMGSFILRNYINRYGTGIDGAVLVGTGQQNMAVINGNLFLVRLLSFFLGSRHIGKFIDRIVFGSYNRRFPDNAGGSAWLNSQPGEAEKYRNDPQCNFTFTLNGFRTLLTLIKRACEKNALRKVPKALPVFFVSGQDDPVGNFGKGVEKAVGIFQDHDMTDVSYKLYEGARHEILLEKQKKEVWEDILAFVQRVIQN